MTELVCKNVDKDMLPKIEALLEQNDVLSIQGFHNQDATDEEEIPSGIVSIYSIDTPVNVDAIPDKIFTYFVLCPIKNSAQYQFTDSDFQVSDKLHEAAPQYSNNPPSLHNRSPKNNFDINSWNAELGDEGFAGIFKKVKDNGRSVDYYIGVLATASNATQELKDYIASSKEPMTYGQLLQDPKFGYVRHLAQRNAQRIAYNIAREYKIPITQLEDISSYNKVGKPSKAVGDQQAQSTIKLMPQGYKGIEAVAVYHNVRPVEEANTICYVVSNPYDGIAVFNMKRNGLGIGLPATTGRKLHHSKVPEMDQKTLQQRSKGLLWESTGSAASGHPDLHPETFRTVDSQFLESMKSLGWRQEGTDNREYLVPVAVKITHPGKKRE